MGDKGCDAMKLGHELEIEKEFDSLLELLDKEGENLRSQISHKRYQQLYGAYRALKWALENTKYRPSDVITNPRYIKLAAKETP